MYLQTVHGKPMVEGFVSRVPPHAADFIESVPLLRALRVDTGPQPADVAGDLCRLERNRVRYILIHLPYARANLGRWMSWFPVEPSYRDKNLIVYSTDGACASLRGRPAAAGVPGGPGS
jgi:hypothetical protein